MHCTTFVLILNRTTMPKSYVAYMGMLIKINNNILKNAENLFKTYVKW